MTTFNDDFMIGGEFAHLERQNEIYNFNIALPLSLAMTPDKAPTVSVRLNNHDLSESRVKEVARAAEESANRHNVNVSLVLGKRNIGRSSHVDSCSLPSPVSMIDTKPIEPTWSHVTADNFPSGSHCPSDYCCHGSGGVSEGFGIRLTDERIISFFCLLAVAGCFFGAWWLPDDAPELIKENLIDGYECLCAAISNAWQWTHSAISAGWKWLCASLPRLWEWWQIFCRRSLGQ